MAEGVILFLGVRFFNETASEEEARPERSQTEKKVRIVSISFMLLTGSSDVWP